MQMEQAAKLMVVVKGCDFPNSLLIESETDAIHFTSCGYQTVLSQKHLLFRKGNILSAVLVPSLL